MGCLVEETLCGVDAKWSGCFMEGALCGVDTLCQKRFVGGRFVEWTLFGGNASWLDVF